MSADPGTSPAEPVRILSDLHLAHPASRIRTVESLRPLIAGAGTVIFNGDTCEQACLGWREEGEARVRELRDLCSEEGARPVFVAGNHDPEISDEGWIELAGGEVLITHGHALYPSVTPWTHEYLNRKKEIHRFLAQQKPSDDLVSRWESTRAITEMLKPSRTRELGKRGGKYLLSAAWPPERCYQILRVWLTMVKQASRFVDRYRPATKVFLFGHFHRPGVWKRKGRLLCNTGAFMRGSRPLLVEVREACLSVLEVNRVGPTFRVGSTRVENLHLQDSDHAR